jgi:hypothetical protein
MPPISPRGASLCTDGEPTGLDTMDIEKLQTRDFLEMRLVQTVYYNQANPAGKKHALDLSAKTVLGPVAGPVWWP